MPSPAAANVSSAAAAPEVLGQANAAVVPTQPPVIEESPGERQAEGTSHDDSQVFYSNENAISATRLREADSILRDWQSASLLNSLERVFTENCVGERHCGKFHCWLKLGEFGVIIPLDFPDSMVLLRIRASNGLDSRKLLVGTPVVFILATSVEGWAAVDCSIVALPVGLAPNSSPTPPTNRSYHALLVGPVHASRATACRNRDAEECYEYVRSMKSIRTQASFHLGKDIAESVAKVEQNYVEQLEETIFDLCVDQLFSYLAVVDAWPRMKILARSHVPLTIDLLAGALGGEEVWDVLKADGQSTAREDVATLLECYYTHVHAQVDPLQGAAWILHRGYRCQGLCGGSLALALLLANWSLLLCDYPLPLAIICSESFNATSGVSSEELLSAWSADDEGPILNVVEASMRNRWLELKECLEGARPMRSPVVESTQNKPQTLPEISPADLQRLKDEAVKAHCEHLRGQSCFICLDDQHKATTSLLCCGATVHVRCLEIWHHQKSQPGSENCPHCRQPAREPAPILRFVPAAQRLPAQEEFGQYESEEDDDEDEEDEWCRGCGNAPRSIGCLYCLCERCCRGCGRHSPLSGRDEEEDEEEEPDDRCFNCPQLCALDCRYHLCGRCCTGRACPRHAENIERDSRARAATNTSEEDEEDAEDEVRDDRCLRCNHLRARDCANDMCGRCCSGNWCARHAPDESTSPQFQPTVQYDNNDCQGCHQQRAQGCPNFLCGACCDGRNGCPRHLLVAAPQDMACSVCQVRQRAQDCNNDCCGRCCTSAAYYCTRHASTCY